LYDFSVPLWKHLKTLLIDLKIYSDLVEKKMKNEKKRLEKKKKINKKMLLLNDKLKKI
jgi:hypothetical protein